MSSLYDVAIIGGGPAGSTAATLLARRGRRVIVFEREKFPRFCIGESLLPHSMPIFDRLGVRQKLEQADFITKHGASVATPCGNHRVKIYFKNGYMNRQPTSWQVTRSVFDQILLDHAAGSGAEVRQETLVDKIDEHPDAVTLHTRARTPGGGREVVHAKYVVDCSGRNSLIAIQHGLRKAYKHLQKFSVYAHYDGVQRDTGVDGSLTRMVRTADAWFWMIPLSQERTSIGVVLDTAEFRRLKMSPEDVLQKYISRTPVVADAMKNAVRAAPVHATGDYSYRNKRMTGDRWIMAGDAAGFIDPIFSTGVFLALESGERAADILHTILDAPGQRRRLFSRYERHLNSVMDLYLRFVNSWYERPEFMDLFLSPTEKFQLAPAVNSILAGSTSPPLAVRLRLLLFHACVFVQRFIPLAPRLSLSSISGKVIRQ